MMNQGMNIAGNVALIRRPNRNIYEYAASPCSVAVSCVKYV